MDKIHQIRLQLFVRLCLKTKFETIAQAFADRAYDCHSHGARTVDTEAEMQR